MARRRHGAGRPTSHQSNAAAFAIRLPQRVCYLQTREKRHEVTAAGNGVQACARVRAAPCVRQAAVRAACAQVWRVKR